MYIVDCFHQPSSHFQNTINLFQKLFLFMIMLIQWLNCLFHRFSLLVVVIVAGVDHRFHNSTGDRKMLQLFEFFKAFVRMCMSLGMRATYIYIYIYKWHVCLGSYKTSFLIHFSCRRVVFVVVVVVVGVVAVDVILVLVSLVAQVVVYRRRRTTYDVRRTIYIYVLCCVSVCASSIFTGKTNHIT